MPPYIKCKTFPSTDLIRFNDDPGNTYLKGILSRVNLLVLTSLDQLHLTMQTLLALVQKNQGAELFTAIIYEFS